MPQHDVPLFIKAAWVEHVLANFDADRRHLVYRFACHTSCSFTSLHPMPKGAAQSTVDPSDLRSNDPRGMQASENRELHCLSTENGPYDGL